MNKGSRSSGKLFWQVVFAVSLIAFCGAAVASDNSDLKELKIQLEMKKGLLGQVSQKVTDLKADPRYCGGKPMTLHIDGDPEGQLRQEIKGLENKIAKIENQKWDKTQKGPQGKVYKTKKKNDWWKKLTGKS